MPRNANFFNLSLGMSVTTMPSKSEGMHPCQWIAFNIRHASCCWGAERSAQCLGCRPSKVEAVEWEKL